MFRVSKGVVMPGLGRIAHQLLREHDALNLHLPQLDGPRLALRARRLGKPVILTYHCDLLLPPGALNRAANAAVMLANDVSGSLSTAIVTYTQDYADHSPYLLRHRKKVRIISPPVEMPQASVSEIAAFAQRWQIDGPVIGMVARLAAEKGVEILLDALPEIVAKHPKARVIFAGPYENVLGEAAYAQRLAPLLQRYREHWTFVGNLSQQELAAFYPNCAAVVVPSLNATEAFGLVQVEAMLSGTPSIASALPGVRQPVLATGMGEVVPIGDSSALAAAVNRIMADRPRYLRPRDEIAARYNNVATAIGYEQLLFELTGA